MSLSPLFFALKSYWYFSMMQEGDVTGLTFIYRLMLLRFFFNIDTSVSKFVMIFWKKSSLFLKTSVTMGSIYPGLTDDPVRLVLLVAELYPNLLYDCSCFFIAESRSLILGNLFISSWRFLISTFIFKIWS